MLASHTVVCVYAWTQINTALLYEARPTAQPLWGIHQVLIKTERKNLRMYKNGMQERETERERTRERKKEREREREREREK